MPSTSCYSDSHDVSDFNSEIEHDLKKGIRKKLRIKRLKKIKFNMKRIIEDVLNKI